jgi:hypothetical protein
MDVTAAEPGTTNGINRANIAFLSLIGLLIAASA